MKIISGGQTGVDRGALDAALDAGIECGGSCPVGRKAEDGTIPDIYPLTEIDSAVYSNRTRKNVIDSDATLIIYFGQLQGGTKFTRKCCIEENKPFLVIDASNESPDILAQYVLDMITEYDVKVLNVAGPRASKVPNAQETTRLLIKSVLQSINN
jgi:hypothetical protein